MPKSPILSREIFYERLKDGSYRDLDWALVNTSLGAMVEPRPLIRFNSSKVLNVDLVDNSYNRRTELAEDEFYKLHGVNGRQLPVDF